MDHEPLNYGRLLRHESHSFSVIVCTRSGDSSSAPFPAQKNTFCVQNWMFEIDLNAYQYCTESSSGINKLLLSLGLGCRFVRCITKQVYWSHFYPLCGNALIILFFYSDSIFSLFWTKIIGSHRLFATMLFKSSMINDHNYTSSQLALLELEWIVALMNLFRNEYWHWRLLAMLASKQEL